MQVSLPEGITKNLPNTKSIVDNAANVVNPNVQKTKNDFIKTLASLLQRITQTQEGQKTLLLKLLVAL